MFLLERCLVFRIRVIDKVIRNYPGDGRYITQPLKTTLPILKDPNPTFEIWDIYDILWRQRSHSVTWKQCHINIMVKLLYYFANDNLFQTLICSEGGWSNQYAHHHILYLSKYWVRKWLAPALVVLRCCVLCAGSQLPGWFYAYHPKYMQPLRVMHYL